ncbi:MAG: zinc-dependent metalloprotease [Cruoricaptor ignavus]|nr:zinc-dependent metalloprotease [Cruoricaptor ignavus]
MKKNLEKISEKVKRIFVFIFCLFATSNSLLAQLEDEKTHKTSTTIADLKHMVSNQSASKRHTKPTTLNLPNGKQENIIWHSTNNSFSNKGIKTYSGYNANGKLTVLISINNNIISGVYFGEKEMNISEENGRLVFSEPKSSICGSCSENDACNHDYFPMAKPNAKSSNTKSRMSDKMLRVFRLAIPISPEIYRNIFNQDTEHIRTRLANMESYINEIYMRDLGVKIVMVYDERLILKETNLLDEDNDLKPGGITSVATGVINRLIGEDSYDVGIAWTRLASGYGGMATRGGLYLKGTKGRAVSGNNGNFTFAHEIGHLFDASHTFETGGKGQIYTEPHEGYSLMGYGRKGHFFSLPNIEQVKNRLMAMPYYTGEKKPLDRLNSVLAIRTSNNAPRILKELIKRSYDLPRETFFQFNIIATDSDNDELLYSAHQMDRLNHEKKTIAVTTPKIPTPNPTVPFQQDYDEEMLWGNYKFLERTSISGKRNFWLSAVDYMPLKENHSTGIDTMKVSVNIIGTAKPFAIKNTLKSNYSPGEQIDLKWDVDTNIFGTDSKVRILLSSDLGKTFPYILAESIPNNGQHTITIPNIPIGNADVQMVNELKNIPAGVIKIEVINHIAYTLSTSRPFNENRPNSFTINSPERVSIKLSRSGTLANTTENVENTLQDITIETIGNVGNPPPYKSFSVVDKNGIIVGFYSVTSEFKNAISDLGEFRIYGIASKESTSILHNNYQGKNFYEEILKPILYNENSTLIASSEPLYVYILDKNENLAVTSETVSKSDISVYPNPANNYIYIKLKNNNVLKIYNTSGQLVHSATLSKGENKIDISTFPPGIYLLTTSSGNSLKIIKS